MEVAICTDGNNRMGMGHVYRTITLAKGIAFPVTFITKSGLEVATKIAENGFPVVRIADDEEILRYLERVRERIVILDRLEVEPMFAARVRRSGHRLVIFGSESDARRFADLVINVIGTGFKNNHWRDKATGTEYYEGPRYYILKDSFFEWRRRKLQPERGRFLILFGGYDTLDLTGKTVEALCDIPEVEMIDVIVGAGYQHYDRLRKTIAGMSRRKEIRLDRDAEDVAVAMAKATTILTSPGMSMFEGLFMKRRVIAFAQTEFHQEAFGRYFKLQPSEKTGELPMMIRGGVWIDPDEEFIKMMEIGEGKRAIIDSIMRLGD